MERAEDLDVRSQVLHPGYPERELEVKQMKHENVKKMVALALLAALFFLAVSLLLFLLLSYVLLSSLP